MPVLLIPFLLYIHLSPQARGATGAGRALLFLLPEELGFLKYLRAAKCAMNEYEFPEKKVANVQVSVCVISCEFCPGLRCGERANE